MLGPKTQPIVNQKLAIHALEQLSVWYPLNQILKLTSNEL